MTDDAVQGIDPRTGRPTGEPIPFTARDDLDAIVASAAAAFEAWSATPAVGRAAALDLVADRLDDGADKLVEIADAETGLGAVRLTSEVTRTSNQLRLFGEVLRDGCYVEAIVSPAKASATPPRPDVRRMLVPRGPVGVFQNTSSPPETSPSTRWHAAITVE